MDVLTNTLKQELSDVKYCGLIVDESTDLSVHKKLIIYVRFVNVTTQDIETCLVGNVRISDSTSATVTQKIHEELKTLNLPLEDLVGLGSDGVSVMFGQKSGVGQLLRKDSPFLTHIHCAAHRLALACSDAAKDILYLKM